MVEGHSLLGHVRVLDVNFFAFFPLLKIYLFQLVFFAIKICLVSFSAKLRVGLNVFVMFSWPPKVLLLIAIIFSVIQILTSLPSYQHLAPFMVRYSDRK